MVMLMFDLLCAHESPHHTVRMSPPAAENLLARITDMQGTPPIGINFWHRNEREVLSKLPGMPRQPIDKANIHAVGVEPKPYVQRFEGTLLRTPQ